MATTAYGNTTPATLRDRFSAAAETASAKFAQYRTFRRTKSELNALTDRELSDLGISRSMITSIAMEAAYGK